MARVRRYWHLRASIWFTSSPPRVIGNRLRAPAIIFVAIAAVSGLFTSCKDAPEKFEPVPPGTGTYSTIVTVSPQTPK